MNDMSMVIQPKSDQLNADSLLPGPITVTITKVEIRAGTEQPVSIHYENENGRPYKPCKSMARVLVQCWGPDASIYTGRSMTLYCDPKVTWAGMAVGGIRISHMSHIDKPITMALTATKGNKKLFTVHPLEIMLSKTEPQKKRTMADWLADLETELAAIETLDALETREDANDVRTVLGKGGDNAERCKALFSKTRERIVPVSTDYEPGAAG